VPTLDAIAERVERRYNFGWHHHRRKCSDQSLRHTVRQAGGKVDRSGVMS
jgi:hypothetical protein